jgi:hypothetical protein
MCTCASEKALCFFLMNRAARVDNANYQPGFSFSVQLFKIKLLLKNEA